MFSTHTLLDCRCRFVGLSCRMREAVVSSASSRTLRFFVCHTKCVRHINAVACGNKRTPAVTLTSACNNNNIPACCCAEASSPVQRCWLWSNHEYCSNPMFQREKVYWRCIILCSMPRKRLARITAGDHTEGCSTFVACVCAQPFLMCTARQSSALTLAAASSPVAPTMAV